jgi:hypothetical protein
METSKFNPMEFELFYNNVLIENPFRFKDEKTIKELEKLPVSLREQELAKKQDLFYKCEVINCGDSCTKVAIGDLIFIDVEIATGGKPIHFGDYIMIKENAILGKYVGTQENI